MIELLYHIKLTEQKKNFFILSYNNFKQIPDYLIINKSIKIKGIYIYIFLYGYTFICSLLDTKPDKLKSALILQSTT